MQNESAVSYKWLKEQIGLDQDTPGHVVETWNRIRDHMRNTDQQITSVQHWASDYWICKGAQFDAQFVAKWDPPDNLDDWQQIEIKLPFAEPTNYASFLNLLVESKSEPGLNSNDAVDQFYFLDDITVVSGNIPMHKAQYIRAWLFTALGPLLMSISLSPQQHNDQLIAETVRRISIPKLFKERLWGLQFFDSQLEILYDCRQSPSGALSLSIPQVGQGEEWMRHWQWLSKEISFQDALASIQLAAQLLRSVPLMEGLKKALTSKDYATEHLVIAVIRRCLLTLKAMAWLEHALKNKWKEVRPQDLVCLAYNALKPEWPRRLISISHRSFEVKPLLQKTSAWGSPLFAIDACYTPAWETNTGMIWGLFANTPVLTLINSPNYSASVWCRRESELIKFLQLQCDFRDKRFVWELRPVEIGLLSAVDENWMLNNSADYSRGLRSSLTSFPPLCNVYVPLPNYPWELNMLRAAGALRLFLATYQEVELANRLAQGMLMKDLIIPIPCLTNNPEGWEKYKSIFHDVAAIFNAHPTMHIWLPETLPVLNPDEAQKFFERIPDMSTGKPALDDVLVALEWMHSLLPILEDANLGDMILIDLRNITKELWESGPEFSLARGIASLRQPPRPVWFIQLAGQHVEEWGLLGGDLPIFTQYTDNQYSWMFEGSFSRDWPDAYAERCGLELSAQLREKCRKS